MKPSLELLPRPRPRNKQIVRRAAKHAEVPFDAPSRPPFVRISYVHETAEGSKFGSRRIDEVDDEKGKKNAGADGTRLSPSKRSD